jgi:hypothetical protein
VQRRLLLDVVVGERAAVLQLLSGEDQTLLVRRDTLLILNLRLDVVNRIGGFNFERNSLSGESLDEDLHTTTQAEHQVERGLLLDVVIRERTAVFELLSGEDETLLIRGNALLVLDLRLHVINRVRGFDFQCDGLAGERLDEDLHATAQAQDEMQSGLLLDVVVGESTAVFELLSGEDQALLIRRDALLVLDLALDVVNRVRGFNSAMLVSKG